MRAWLCFAVLSAAGCSQILGIEDVSLQSRPDAAPVFDAPPPAPPKTLMLTIAGDGKGRVTSAPAGIDCPTTCSADFPKGTEVTLSQSPGAGSSFKSWSGCAPMGTGCKITLDLDSAAGAEFSDNSNGYNFVFGTVEKYPVTMFNPITNADALCNQSAQTAGLPGTYIAWISTTSQSAKERLGTTARGWVRVDGLPFADRVQDLLAGKIFYPVRLNARGTNANFFEPLATATDELGQLQAGANCNDWMTTDMAQGYRAGNVDSTTWGWTEAFGHNTCNDEGHLLCFGIERNKQLTPQRTAGRLAFLSTRPMPYPLAKVEDADAICQGDAMNAGITGKTFKALISMVGTSAASRMAAGAPWVRYDGMRLVAEGDNMLEGGPLLTTINITAEGDYQMINRIATGSRIPADPGFAAQTCDNWTSLQATATHRAGLSHTGSDWWFNGYMAPCNEAPNNLRLYCLEQ